MGKPKLSDFFVPFALIPLLLFSYFLRAIGLRLMGIAGVCLGDLLLQLHFRKAIVIANLRLAMGNELTEKELHALVRKIYRNIGQSFLEIARNFSLTKKQMQQELILSKEDQDYIEKMFGRGKGIIFISAHIANWELLATGMAARGLPAAVVVKKMNNPISQALIERQRLRTGLEVIYSGGTIEKMRVALSKGKGIGFMVDQNITGTRGIRANFFGTPASSIRALAKLIKETGTAVVPICVFRMPNGTQKVQLLPELPYIVPDASKYSAEELALREEWLNTQQYQTAIETLIRMKPEQWLWIHRRWKANRAPLVFETAHIGN